MIIIEFIAAFFFILGVLLVIDCANYEKEKRNNIYVKKSKEKYWTDYLKNN